MIKIKPQYILLYFIGIFLLIFGNRDFIEKIQANEDEKIKQKKSAELAENERNRKFETQKLSYDSIAKRLVNKNISFQTVIVQANFNAQKSANKVTKIETNDDENASDSL